MSLSPEQSRLVRQQIADCLATEIDEVVPAANFFTDLGGESIDVLDLTFRLEKALGVRPNFSVMKDEAALDFDELGRLTPESLERARALFSDLPIPSSGSVDSQPIAPRDLFTVEMIEAIVARAIASRTE